ncbi:hypothetical protein COHA_009290 [Chlorella ohadii]|uniref:Uncharacterized protein n=1 Tax=Chlorella ohadii TaxID=2649997 RepID=A0AAD5GY89_9CHLO|nr:hypothetical protein COHA_009290 [Chlorella ohadii]
MAVTSFEMAVTSFNVSSRLHNRMAVGNDPLLPLRKEQHAQPAPVAAAGAAFGALPPPGVFPPSWLALLGAWTHAHMNTLATFYAEDFGPQNMQLADRKQLFIAFIIRA